MVDLKIDNSAGAITRIALSGGVLLHVRPCTRAELEQAGQRLTAILEDAMAMDADAIASIIAIDPDFIFQKFVPDGVRAMLDWLVLVEVATRCVQIDEDACSSASIAALLRTDPAIEKAARAALGFALGIHVHMPRLRLN